MAFFEKKKKDLMNKIILNHKYTKKLLLYNISINYL